jgi:calcineurin-like phosphoesterase family protein
MIWFTADLHLGHTNILQYCNRPFSSVEVMDAELIQRWNSQVDIDDTIYHIGDFCFKNPQKYIEQLTGKKFFINGSHDKNMQGSVLPSDIVSISPLNDEYGNPRKIVMCHYAMRSWSLSHYASWHLFGHHHGKLEPYGLSFDVGVDTNGFYPYSLEDIEYKMKKLKPIVDYRVR